MSDGSKTLEVFVFPLPGAVLFPSTSQPLNIFEPRYLEMISDTLTSGKLVALTGEAGVGTVAGCGRVQILEKRADGTMMILLRAEMKVRINQIDASSKPYLIAEVTEVPEKIDLDRGNVFFLNRLMREVSGWLERNLPQPKKRDEFLDQMSTDEERVNTACTLLIADADSRQQLLDVNDLNERLRLVATLLETGAASH